MENLNSKKILGLYLGDYNTNFDKYKELAMKNIDFDFFAIFNEGLIKNIKLFADIHD